MIQGLVKEKPSKSGSKLVGWHSILTNWELEFTERIRIESKSRKAEFTIKDAVLKSSRHATEEDRVFIQYRKYLKEKPLSQNDYFKYVDSYRKGKKLNPKFFKYDLDKLEGYYSKVDEGKTAYNPFSEDLYRKYVLFMSLKLNGFYKDEYDLLFGITRKDNRIYSPLTSVPSVLRPELPFDIKEYDIARAFPTFADMDCGYERKTDAYELMDKKELNKLMNTHKDVSAATLEGVRSQLLPVFEDVTAEVMTEERFNNRGQMYRDLAIHEERAIIDFVESNGIQDYVRLHDGVVVLKDVECPKLEFGKIEFKEKQFPLPELTNQKINFYEIKPDGHVETSPKTYKDFFAQEDYIRVTEEGNDSITVFKGKNKIVSPINVNTDVPAQLTEYANEYDTSEVENKIAKDSRSVINEGFKLMPAKPMKYYCDTSSTFAIPFKNGLAKYDHTAKEGSVLEYDGVEGFFSKHGTQNHEFEFRENENQSDFELFLAMAAVGKDPREETYTSQDEDVFKAFCSMVGYMCHGYKAQSYSPAIILSDSGANDDSRNGGRGKTIITKAISNVVDSILKGGSEFDPSYTHVFADLDKRHRAYIIDDVPANFKYDELYTNIVGDISCQRKGSVAQTINFKETPKFVITTNWSVGYNKASTSTNRRFVEYQLSDYFNLDRTPLLVFRRTMFQDWNGDDWNAFYNFIFYCVGVYLEEGLIKIAYDKDADGYRARFYNDVILSQFEEAFYKMNAFDDESFTVTDFLKSYQRSDNPLRFDKLFHQNNTKGLIQSYISKNNLDYLYKDRYRKWFKK